MWLIYERVRAIGEPSRTFLGRSCADLPPSVTSPVWRRARQRLAGFFGELNHVTSPSDGLCYFRRSCDRPPLQPSAGAPQRDSVTAETKISGLCRRRAPLAGSIGGREREGGEKEKKGQQKPLLFSLKQDCVCCCARGSGRRRASSSQ